jgi:hypothetical protein
MTPALTLEHTLLKATKILHALLDIQIEELNMQNVRKLKEGE